MTRRITNSKGESAPLWVWRIVAVTALPFIVTWAFTSTLVREIGHAFWYAANSVKQEIEILKRYWNGGVLP